MATYKYTRIDGQRVEKNVAAAFKKWVKAFKKETGLTLHVTSGTRTVAEQTKGRADYVAGRTTVKWAIPTESSHCEVGPSGPRALDIHDSGSDAGVTVKGSKRWNIAVRLGRKFGFTWGGWGVPDYEGWHFENHKVKVGVYGAVKKAAAAVASAAKKAVSGKPKAMLSWRWTGIQRMLKRYYRYTGRIDNIPGSGTIAAFQRFLNDHGYARRALGRNLVVDGKFGVNTCKAAQQWLKEKYGYTGKIDAIPGRGTKTAWSKAERANNSAFK